jgi:hypothetical protein
VDCWGLNGNGQAQDQTGPYTTLDAGQLHTCAVLANGNIDCWGNDLYGEGGDQTGSYTQVSAGLDHTCALKPDGGVDCWGLNDNGKADNQIGPYTWVSAGFNHTCALKPDGSVDCWGDNAIGQAEDQPGPYGPYEPGNNTYTFTGFFLPIANPPVLNKVLPGKTVRVSFGLGGDFGLDVFAAGYPASRPVNCRTHVPLGPDEPITSNQGLQYNRRSDVYTYPWSTSGNWGGCRELVVRFDDGQEFTALFRFD